MSKKLTGKALTQFEVNAMCGKMSWTAYGKSKPAKERGQKLKPSPKSVVCGLPRNRTLTPILFFWRLGL